MPGDLLYKGQKIGPDPPNHRDATETPATATAHHHVRLRHTTMAAISAPKATRWRQRKNNWFSDGDAGEMKLALQRKNMA